MPDAVAQPRAAVPLRFSTEDIPVHDRLAVFREVLGRTHLRLDLEPTGEAPLRSQIEFCPFGAVSLCFGITTALNASRTRELVQDGDGNCTFVIPTGAAYGFTAKDTDELVADGGGALVLNSAVGTIRYLATCDVATVRVRQSDLAIAVRDLDEKPLRHARTGTPAFGLLKSYVAMLRRLEPEPDPVLAGRVGAHLIDLVALALGATRDAAAIAQDRGLRAARLAGIKADIENHLANPGLSADAVGARQGVTGRYVRMLLESEGLSFSELVMERRLARAHALLCDPRFLDRTVGSIAFDVGFSDLSYFNRGFRRRFGATPSDLRERARREN